MLHFFNKKERKERNHHHHSQQQRQSGSHTGEVCLAALQQPPKGETGLVVTSSSPCGFVIGVFFPNTPQQSKNCSSPRASALQLMALFLLASQSPQGDERPVHWTIQSIFSKNSQIWMLQGKVTSSLYLQMRKQCTAGFTRIRKDVGRQAKAIFLNVTLKRTTVGIKMLLATFKYYLLLLWTLITIPLPAFQLLPLLLLRKYKSNTTKELCPLAMSMALRTGTEQGTLWPQAYWGPSLTEQLLLQSAHLVGLWGAALFTQGHFGTAGESLFHPVGWRMPGKAAVESVLGRSPSQTHMLLPCPITVLTDTVGPLRQYLSYLGGTGVSHKGPCYYPLPWMGVADLQPPATFSH